MSKVIIVDENDNVIGFKERSEVLASDFGRVSALWVVNSKDEVLLAKRAINKKFHPGRWSPAVAGTVEEGESYKDNIYKEAEEELGITGYHFEEWVKLKMQDGHNYFVQLYLLKKDLEIKDLKICEREIDDVKWFNMEELKQMKEKDLVPTAYRIIKEYIKKELN